MKNMRVPLRVVFYKDDSLWVAHCLEFDLMGDGESKGQALERLTEAIGSQVEATAASGNWDNLFRPAEGKVFAMFAAGTDVVGGELHLKFDSITIDNASAREYVDQEDHDHDCICV